MTIAVTIAFDYPTAAADLAVYRQSYGLPPCTVESGCFSKVNQAGKAGKYPKANAGWAAEAALDLDMASAICPKCHLLLVEADDNFLENLPQAVARAATMGADVISDSWGGEEFSEESTFDPFLHHPNVPVLFASGDDGFISSYPAASPEVIAVGGTSLVKDQSSRGWRERAWIGAGSGCSEYEPKPSWQADAGCANRAIADVAAVADPETPVSVYDSYGGYGGWLLFGGTSASTPLMAGLEALSTPSERSAGAERFWTMGEEGRLFDVTEGRNGNCEPAAEYLCLAGMGYDGPTGWGTPGASRPGPPVVATELATDVGPGGATLKGSVNPNGDDTAFRFEYGTTSAYGTSIPLSDQDIGGGEEPVPVSEELSGLSRNTTYHYRVVAGNGDGTTFGGDRTFVTSPWAPEGMSASPGGDELFGTSCASSTFCDAVGAQEVYFEGPFYNEEPVGQRWEGGDWVRESPPAPHAAAPGYASRLEDVSCVSTTACVAIGENYEIGVGYGVLAEQWDGSKWTILPVAVPLQAALNQNGTYEVRMHAISCASEAFCMAVGEVTTDWESLSPGEIGALVEIWNGEEWTAAVPPGPLGWKGNLLWGVSCLSDESCVAVGESRSGGARKPLIERWEEGEWTLDPSPVSSGGLQGVSCPAADSCIAVGASEGQSGGSGLGMVWNGVSWTTASPAVPLRGVSCAGVDSCVGVGGERSHGAASAFAATWDGSKWTTEGPVLPADASDDAMELNDVECAAAKCSAVGWYWSWGLKPLAERINLSPPPPPPPPPLPDVATEAGATAIGPTAATVHGTVNPHSTKVTNCHFEYGTDTAYGGTAPCKPAAPGSGAVAVAVSATLGGLQPATTYHFRLVATNGGGTAHGDDQIFATPATGCGACPVEPTIATAAETRPSPLVESGNPDRRRAFAECAARATRRFRRARRAAMHERGAARKAALARAARRRRHALALCRTNRETRS